MKKLYLVISLFVATTGNIIASDPEIRADDHAQFERNAQRLLDTTARTNQDDYLELYDIIVGWTAFSTKSPLEDFEVHRQSLGATFSQFQAIQPSATLQTMSRHQLLALQMNIGNVVNSPTNN